MRNQFKFITSTISKEILIAATNLSVALFLARQFQPTLFINFTTIILIASSLTQINRGIQFSILVEKLVAVNSARNRKLSLSTISIIEVILWITITPLLSSAFNLPLMAVLVAAIAFPATIISSCVAGEFQQSFRFESWQTWLTITGLFQIPLVIVGVFGGANLTFFVISAFAPTFFSSFIVHSSIRGKLRNSTVLISAAFSKGLYISLLFLNYNLVIFLLKYLVIGNDLGRFSLVVYPLSTLVGISSLFGSYRLANSMNSDILFGTKDHLKSFALIFFFMQIAALIVYSIGPLIFPILLGSNYGTDFKLLESVLAASAYSFWGFAYWLTQSQLHKIRTPILCAQTLLVFTEFGFLLLVPLTPTAMFVAHGVFGAIVIFTLFLAIYSTDCVVHHKLRFLAK